MDGELQCGLNKLYQMLILRDELQSTSPARSPCHQRSVSQIIFPEKVSHCKSEESDWISECISLNDVYNLLDVVLKERFSLQQQVSELNSMVEVARRERIMAIDERDKLLHQQHLIKLSAERSEATLRLMEGEKVRLFKRCKELEHENSSLKLSSSTAIDQWSKIKEETDHLRLELKCIKEQRDELVTITESLEHHVKEQDRCQHKPQVNIDKCSSALQRLDKVAHSLKAENEVLGGQHYITLEVCLMRTSSQPWGFRIDSRCDCKYMDKEYSLVVSGLAPESPAISALRCGDFILKVNGISTESMNKEEVGNLIRNSNVSLPLTVLRICSPEPVSIRLTLSPEKKSSYGFSYQTHYVISHVDKSSNSLLEVGDEIVKMQGDITTGLRTSQFRKLLQSFHDDIECEIRRYPKSLQLTHHSLKTLGERYNSENCRSSDKLCFSSSSSNTYDSSSTCFSAVPDHGGNLMFPLSISEDSGLVNHSIRHEPVGLLTAQLVT